MENYYSKWKKNLFLEDLSYSDIKQFWNKRINDIDYITKKQNLSESFINHNKEDDIDLFLESIDYNIPKNTKNLKFNFKFKDNNIFLECLAYNSKGVQIKKNNNLRLLEDKYNVEPLFLNENNIFNVFTVREGMKNFKDAWYRNNKIYKNDVEFNFIDK
jgi:hypothetical protein